MSELMDRLNGVRIGSTSLWDLLGALVILIVFLICRRIIKKIFDKALARTRLDGTLKSFLGAAVNVLLWLLVVMIVADKLGIPMTSLVAVLSVVGLALSLSVQNLLTNLFSGMTILGTKPFAEGNFVDIDGIMGTVKAVGLFYTVLLSYDGKVVRLPNGMVTSAKVTNFSDHPYRRVDLEISASYDDDPETVKTALREAFAMTDGTVETPAPLIGVLDYGNSSIKYALYAWVEASRFFDVKFALTENVRKAFDSHGVTMSYDHLNVHLDRN